MKALKLSIYFTFAVCAVSIAAYTVQVIQTITGGYLSASCIYCLCICVFLISFGLHSETKNKAK